MRAISVLGLLLLLCSGSAKAFTNDIAMLKITRNQMVLSQKITKLYFMLGANLNSEKTQKAFYSAIKEFDNGNLSLKQFAKDSAVEDDVRPMTLSWQVYKKQLLLPFNLVKANELLQMNEQLTKAEQNFLQDVQTASTISIPPAVLESDRQQILSQKIATYYLALYTAAPVPDLEKSFQRAVDSYEAGLTRLINRTDNTAEINKYLSKTKGQWEFSKPGLAYQKNGRFTPFVILATTDAMEKNMDTVALELQQGLLPQKALTSAKL